MSGLTIYKASAGSGKTFKLTQQYLFMVIRNPSQYRNILAVTFTNKATGEMKFRIVNELHNLSEGLPSKHAKTLITHLKIDEKQLQLQASRALNMILHDYSRFSVSTIDHFFQKVIRNFAREIGLQAGYNLELDQTEILNYVVDDLMLAAAEDEQLKTWLIEFAQTRIKEGKSWDFRNEILMLARELSSEQVKDLSIDLVDVIKDKKALGDYVKKLDKTINQFENHLKSLGEKGVQVVEKVGLTYKDFKYTGNAVTYFYYLKNLRKDKFEPGKNARKGLEDPENWPGTKVDDTTRQLILGLAANQLMSILQQAVDFYEQEFRSYQTAIEIKKNIYILGILVDIQKRMNDYCREKNLFLISDASELLRKIIGNNDAPFVYEKTGSRYHNYMLDEFQDTSRFQWDNFKPLIKNSLAENGYNMLVGDIKQSIYRWRNSDWKILSDEVQADFSASPPDVKLLDANYRSTQNIIAFNNTFFAMAPGLLQNQFNSVYQTVKEENPWERKILEAYSDVLQKLPFPKEGGYVRTDMIPYQNGNFDEAKEKIFERTLQDLEALQDKGYKLSEIAILVRKNSEGQEVANAILEYKNSPQASVNYRYDVISNDSLYINNAESVRFLLALFKYLVQPDDMVNRAFIKELYQRTILNNDMGEDDMHELFNIQEKEDGFEKWMPETFLKSEHELKKTPLYELSERLISLFKITELKQEVPYLQAFQNIVLDFSRRNPADLNTFLEWWKINGSAKKLQLPEDYDAIRIITIHKAKGLEYKAVLIPFTNWELDNPSSGIRKNFLWCEPRVEELKELKAIPLTYTSRLATTWFYEEYYSELFHNYVDNLNLLYVAFTRAEEVLISYCPLLEKKDGTLNYIDKGNGVTHAGELLHFIFESPQIIQGDDDKNTIDAFQQYWNPQEQIFQYGIFEKMTPTEELSEDQFKLESYPAFMEKPPVQLTYQHSEFFKDKPDLMGRVDYGKIMHQIFEYIVIRDDIEPAIDRVYFEGRINSQEKDELLKQVFSLLENEKVKDWFSGYYKVFSERDMLLPNGKVYRPDRVMMSENETVIVDYKFGEKSKKHQKQVAFYTKQLDKMGCPNPTGYLWYVNQNEIEKVD